MILNYQKRNAKPHCEFGRVNELHYEKTNGKSYVLIEPKKCENALKIALINKVNYYAKMHCKIAIYK
jgi:hypothetical protein